jgi:hypothetical protein
MTASDGSGSDREAAGMLIPGCARPSRVELDGETFPDVDPLDPPQTLGEWIAHFCHGSEGAVRLAELLGRLADSGYEQARRCTLHAHFSTETPPISEDQLDTLLYKRRMPVGPRGRIVRYLWVERLLPGETAPSVKIPGTIRDELHASLARFHEIPAGSLAVLHERLTGLYWAFCASSRDPGMYDKGLLTLHAPGTGGQTLLVHEEYRVAGDPETGTCERHEVYEGLILQRSHRPFMVSNLRLPAHRSKTTCARADTDLTAIRSTFIAATETHSDGHIVSMLGLANVCHDSRGFHAAAICFERIPAGYRKAPRDELGVLPAAQLPPSVLRRLNSLVTTNGIIRL